MLAFPAPLVPLHYNPRLLNLPMLYLVHLLLLLLCLEAVQVIMLKLVPVLVLVDSVVQRRDLVAHQQGLVANRQGSAALMRQVQRAESGQLSSGVSEIKKPYCRIIVMGH